MHVQTHERSAKLRSNVSEHVKVKMGDLNTSEKVLREDQD